MYVIKARTHGGLRNDSETHSTDVTGLHSRLCRSCNPVTQSCAFHCHFAHPRAFWLYSYHILFHLMSLPPTGLTMFQYVAPARAVTRVFQQHYLNKQSCGMPAEPVPAQPGVKPHQGLATRVDVGSTAQVRVITFIPWWCYNDMEILSALLALCEGNPPVTGGFLSQRANNEKHRCFICY